MSMMSTCSVREEAAERLAEAAVRLLDLFERALRLRVAYRKCVLVGSSPLVGAAFGTSA